MRKRHRLENYRIERITQEKYAINSNEHGENNLEVIHERNL